ncbi:unnamed protein product [Urochloa decumbens]|uniref:Protein kinase domain-containing protein n=1 Tax=Urochloa decumbens TaxID=240449 RepID=A0ABC9B2E5_9POAL
MALLLPGVLLVLAAAAAAAATSSPCPERCGGVNIPYPFGIGDKRCFRQGFEIECRNKLDSEVPVLAKTNMTIPVLDLSVAPLPEARVRLPVAFQCFDPAGNRTAGYSGNVNFNQQGVYRISNARNELYVLGCNTPKAPGSRAAAASATPTTPVTTATASTQPMALATSATVTKATRGTPTSSTDAKGNCEDNDGSYDCKCPPGYHSNNGNPKEEPCIPNLPSSAKLIIGITVGTSVVLFMILGTGVFYKLKRIKKKEKERQMEAIEKKNGSERLKNVKTLLLFTKEELDQITNNNSVPLGKGGFGEVHKGTLSDMTEVAVKTSNEVTKATLHEFVREVEIQSRMMHRNVLKLLGCCLRVDVPLLVYEYAAKGSLQDILHGKSSDQQREPLTLRSRLDIAIGSAQGLAYMHSYTENGIQHADVKPGNILLDAGLVPKISDFGLSKAFIAGKDYTMNVIGCLAYMDPVYKDTGRLTPKSDVYSFGIVLLELISRKPVGTGESSLVKQFQRAFEQHNTGKVMFVRDIAEEEEDIPTLDEISILALKCLKEKVEDRPAMVSVASALVMLKVSWEEKRQRFSSTSGNLGLSEGAPPRSDSPRK